MSPDLKRRLTSQIPLGMLVLLVVAVGAAEPTFFTGQALLGLMADTMTLFLMASGATFVIMMGGIDLSVQAIASMTSVILAFFLPELGLLAILVAILAGTGAGAVGGLSHTLLRIPSFIATLAVGGVMLAIAYLFSGAGSVSVSGDHRDAYLNWMVGDILGIDNEIWIGLVVLGMLLFVETMTPFGRFCRAVGSGEQAVAASGVRVTRIKIYAFVLSGTTAGFSGALMAARLGSGSPTLANEFLLPAIAAIIVGGTALTGGVGGIWRTFIGALIIVIVRVGMTFLGVDVFWHQIVFGVVLVIAVAATIDRSKIQIVK